MIHQKQKNPHLNQLIMIFLNLNLIYVIHAKIFLFESIKQIHI